MTKHADAKINGISLDTSNHKNVSDVVDAINAAFVGQST